MSQSIHKWLYKTSFYMFVSILFIPIFFYEIINWMQATYVSLHIIYYLLINFPSHSTRILARNLPGAVKMPIAVVATTDNNNYWS